MDSRDLQIRRTRDEHFRARAGVAGLSVALLFGLVCCPQSRAARGPVQSNAPGLQASKLDEYDRLEQTLLGAGPREAAAAQAALIAWLEDLERVTFAGGTRDPKALSALYYGAVLLAQRPELSERRAAWFQLAERAVAGFQDADTHRYFATGLLVTQAQDLLARKDVRGAQALTQRALAENVEPLLEPLALHTLAEAQRRSGSKLEALDTVALAETRIAKLGPGFEEGPKLLAQGELLRAQNDSDLGLPDLAWAALVRCKQAATQARAQEVLDSAKLFEANLLLATDRKEDVIRLLRPSGETGGPPLSEALQLRLGRAFADLDPGTPETIAEARALIGGALADVDLDPEERRMAQIALADFEIRQGDLDAAERLLQEARTELSSLQHGGTARNRPGDEAEIEMYASRLLRARGLDPESGKDQLGRLEQAFDRLIEELARNERPRGGVGFLHFRTRRFLINELLELSLAVEGPERGFERALEALIEAQQLGSLSRALGPRACSAAEVREVMTRADGGVLVFVPDHHRTLVLAFDAQPGGLCESVARQGEWRPVVDLWLREIGTSPASLDEQGRARNLAAIDRHGRRVADLLFTPALRERIAGWKSVTIVGADLMNGLPFEALPLGGELLGIRCAIDRAPSLPVDVQLSRRRIAHERPPALQAGLWLVAAPLIPDWAGKPLQDLGKIPFGEQEALALQRPYPKLERACFRGELATRAALEDPRLAEASVLQITTHGIEVQGVERPAELVLRPMSRADDGLLDCDEVERLHVPDTVVLSVCGAAQGEQRYGEDGSNHLGGAFLRAGASCVVLSSHVVEAQAMQALMEVFHQRLCAGDTRAESMRAARASVARIPRFSHPFYFAQVQVIGLGQTVR